MARKSKGRQKIEMTKMSKESNLLVTFSKRRSGLFKKASELCTLCGVEIAIIVFSPGKKVFSFGHPSVESILDRFLTSNNPAQSSNTLQLVEAHRNANVRELNMHLTELINQLEVEKNRGEEFTKMGNARKEICWWEAPINELGVEELEQLKMAMEGLKRNVDTQAEKITMEGSNLGTFFPGSTSRGGLGHVGGSVDVMKGCGMGLSMTPYGYALGYNNNNNNNNNGRGFF